MKKGEIIIKRLAEQRGVSEDEIRKGIQVAIDEGFYNSDPKIAAMWRAIPHAGEKPNPEETLFHVGELTKKSMQ